MSEVSSRARQRNRTLARLWLLTGVVIAAILAANIHLVYVAVTSQPACVSHIRQGEGNAERGRFSAAQSSCSPLKQGHRS